MTLYNKYAELNLCGQALQLSMLYHLYILNVANCLSNVESKYDFLRSENIFI